MEETTKNEGEVVRASHIHYRVIGGRGIYWAVKMPFK